MIAELVEVAKAELYGADPHADTDTKWAAAIQAVVDHLGVEYGGAIISADELTELATNLGNIVAESARGKNGDVRQLASASISIIAGAIVTDGNE